MPWSLSSTTSIEVTRVLLSPVFHDPSSYMRCVYRYCTTIPLRQVIVHNLHLIVEVNHRIRVMTPAKDLLMTTDVVES